MPNPVKYAIDQQAGAIRSQNIHVYVSSNPIGPTSSNGFWSGITPPEGGGYTLYFNKATGGPSIHCVSGDGDLLDLMNGMKPGVVFDTAEDVLKWFIESTDKMAINMDYPSIVTDGLIFLVDFGLVSSYPKYQTKVYSVDQSNYGQFLTLENGATYVDGTVTFDGTNDYVGNGWQASITNAAPRTMECWVYIESDSTTCNVMGYGSNASRALFDTVIWIDGGGYNRVIGHYYGAGNDTISTLPANNTINMSAWNQIVHIYDGTNCKIYTNGSFSNQVAINLFTTKGDINLGAGSYSAYNYFRGSAAIQLMYDRALTSGEVTKNYDAYKTRFGL